MAGTGGSSRKVVVGQRRATMARAPRPAVRARHMGIAQPALTGSISLEVEGVRPLVDREIERAADAAKRAYDEVLYPWFRGEVEAKWPVRTGFSRSVLQCWAEPLGDTLVMRVQCLAPYALYITQAGATIPNVVQRLVWRPSREVADRMMVYLGDHLAKGG